MGVYLSSLIPALAVNNVGSVLAVTGIIGASCLSYIGPGLIYFAVYGEAFTRKVDTIWGKSNENNSNGNKPPQDRESTDLLPKMEIEQEIIRNQRNQSLVLTISWYLLLLPMWCYISNTGKSKLNKYQEEKLLKSPHINRLGKCCAPVDQVEFQEEQKRPCIRKSGSGMFNEAPSSLATQPPSGPKILPYGAIVGGNKAIGRAIVAKKRPEQDFDRLAPEEEKVADVDVPPTWADFLVAMFFVGFGMVALGAGLVS